MALPFSRTVHAPQTPTPQPNFVPVRESASRIIQTSGMSSSTSRTWRDPFTVKATSRTRTQDLPRMICVHFRIQDPASPTLLRKLSRAGGAASRRRESLKRYIVEAELPPTRLPPQKSDVRSQQSEIRNQKSEVSGQW